VLDRLNAVGIPATPLHAVEPVVDGPCLIRLEGWSEAGTGPRSLVLATGDAQAGTRSRLTSTCHELVVEGDSYRRRQRPAAPPVDESGPSHMMMLTQPD